MVNPSGMLSNDTAVGLTFLAGDQGGDRLAMRHWVKSLVLPDGFERSREAAVINFIWWKWGC